MENLPIAFYATVCGVLSLFAPRFGGVMSRIAVGALVGAGSAFALPNIIAMLY